METIMKRLLLLTSLLITGNAFGMDADQKAQEKVLSKEERLNDLYASGMHNLKMGGFNLGVSIAVLFAMNYVVCDGTR